VFQQNEAEEWPSGHINEIALPKNEPRQDIARTALQLSALSAGNIGKARESGRWADNKEAAANSMG
jgi:hypothetical protein